VWLKENSTEDQNLRDLEGVPYDRMAETMHCTEQAARLKVFRARTRLRDLMLKAIRRRLQGSPLL